MNNAGFQLFALLKHLLSARGSRWLHPPRFFKLHQHIRNFPKNHPALIFHQNLLRRLSANSQPLSYDDPGAGTYKSVPVRTVSSLTRSALTPTHHLKPLLALIDFEKPTFFLELGTCLGATALTIQKTFPDLPVFTIEGASPVAAFAENLFREHQEEKIQIFKGKFAETLPEVLEKIPHNKPGIFFIDGHHAEKPTLQYTRMILDKAAPGSILIFDDIHWSPGMLQAWKKILQLPETRASVTWFRAGWVFTDPDLSPGHWRWRDGII